MPGPVRNAIEIAACPDAVFDYMTDLRNEPRWNPQMRRVEKVTAGDIDRGSRFRLVFRRGVGEAMVEHTAFARPRSWSSVSRSRLLDVASVNSVEPVPGGSLLIIRTRLRPHGPMRLVSPLLGRWIQRTWARDLRTVKAQVEHTSQEGP
jgi:hypothetical protein